MEEIASVSCLSLIGHLLDTTKVALSAYIKMLNVELIFSSSALIWGERFLSVNQSSKDINNINNEKCSRKQTSL